MSKKEQTQKSNPEVNTSQMPAEGMAEILYQKMGDKWYAFSLLNDEVFVGSISAEEVAEGNVKQIKAYRITGNS